MPKKKESAVAQVKVTLVRSPISTPDQHRRTLTGLGLRRMHQTVQLIDTPAVRGMIKKIDYLLKCEEVV